MSETVREREARLPGAESSNPDCGACGSETDFDGDDFVCEGCGIYFSPTTMAASFLDEDAPACGAPCDNSWHRTDAIKPGMSFECRACPLPTGHSSLHWTGCEAVLAAPR